MIGPTWPSVPALFTATSRRPNRATVLSMRARTSSSLRTSVLMNSASDPRERSSETSALPTSSRRPATTTFAPFLANATAAARPMPVSPPVIKTTGVSMVSSSIGVASCRSPCPSGAWSGCLKASHRSRGMDLGARRPPEKDFASWGHVSEAWVPIELRHLRYFIAVAETGSLTEAAERRLHTSQPSLSRQIRDLEYEVGVELLSRGARGVELTAAGKAFLDHARLALMQVDATVEAARRAARPARKNFDIGFQTGHEMKWLPRAMHVLRDQLKNIQVVVSSDYSPNLAEALARGRMDLAIMRLEPGYDLGYHVVDREPLIVLMPRDHRLTAHEAVSPQDFTGEIFIGGSNKAGVLRAVTEDYLRRSEVDIKLDHGVDNMAMAMSLVASTRGLALMPAYAKNLLPWSVVARPLEGEAPTIDLAIGYHKSNTSPTLKLFLSRIEELTDRISNEARLMSGPGSAAAPR